jgi:hypothetical protein
MNMKNLYLVLAVVGGVVPYLFFVPFFASAGLDLGTFIGGLFANGAAGGFSADLLISSAVFWIYLFSRADGPKPWLYVALNLAIGLSCALPAYLYAVSRQAEVTHAVA